MPKRLSIRGMCAICLVVLSTTLSPAANPDSPRYTPLVRGVARAFESVVNIHSEKTSHSGDAVFATSAKPKKVNGMGTGIVVDPRGYIVTNHHVVKDVDTLRVTLADGSTYTAKTISFDFESDLALIKISPSRPLSVMPLGTSSDLMLAETVVALGNPYGYEHSVTSGIISALGRDVEVNETQAYKNLIQTDASINPGNSGGPLVNMDGEVIGINVAIRAGAQRIGFAIPIDDARLIIAKLISIERLQDMQHGLLATDSKDGKQRELVVDAARPDTPAAEAGFEPGDVIIKAGNVKIVDAVDFERALLDHKPGQVIPVVVKRGDTTESLELKLAPFHGNSSSERVAHHLQTSESLESKSWNLLGLKLARVSPHEPRIVASRYRGGMRVLEVRQGSPAARNGLRAGDILVGLHIWETINNDNIQYILDHPQFHTFNPLKFFVLRGRETLYGHMRVVAHQQNAD